MKLLTATLSLLSSSDFSFVAASCTGIRGAHRTLSLTPAMYVPMHPFDLFDRETYTCVSFVSFISLLSLMAHLVGLPNLVSANSQCARVVYAVLMTLSLMAKLIAHVGFARNV